MIDLRQPLAVLASGWAYHEDRPPCDASTLIKFRQLLGEEGVKELLAQPVDARAEVHRFTVQVSAASPKVNA